MYPKLLIQNREVSKYCKPLIIAEIGINHSGSLEVAKAMVDSAYKARVEVIKHQTHIVADEMSNLAKKQHLEMLRNKYMISWMNVC